MCFGPQSSHHLQVSREPSSQSRRNLARLSNPRDLTVICATRGSSDMGTHIGVDLDIVIESTSALLPMTVLGIATSDSYRHCGLDCTILSSVRHRHRGHLGASTRSRGFTCIWYEDQQNSDREDIGIEQDNDEVYSPQQHRPGARQPVSCKLELWKRSFHLFMFI